MALRVRLMNDPRHVQETPMPGLSDHAVACLECACDDAENGAAELLLEFSGATSATGVLAAFIIATNDERETIRELARAAIGQQRDRCTPARRLSPDSCAARKWQRSIQ
jgi:hypothetical protein